MIANKGGNFIAELKRSLYSKGSIDKAIKDFSNISKIKKTQVSNSTIILLPEEEFITGLEFCNYLLGLEKIKREEIKE